MRRVKIAVIVSLLSTALTAAWPPLPAAADHNTCDAQEFCIWANPNRTGDFHGPDGDDPNWPCGVFCSPDVDNNEDSLDSRKSFNAVLVFDADNFGGGVKYCVHAQTVDNDINNAVDEDGNSNAVRGSNDCSGFPLP